MGRLLKLITFSLVLLVTLSGGVQAQNPLDPMLAFKPSVSTLDDETLEVHFAIAPGYYLYRDKIRFAVPDGPTLGSPEFPAGEHTDDENFGQVEIFREDIRIRLPVTRTTPDALAFDLKVVSQGCAEGIVCYPPQTQILRAELPVAGSLPPAPPSSVSSTATNSSDESGLIAATLARSGLWTSVLLFFVAGLGLSLTPCVFPMIPILSGIIVGQGNGISRGRAFGLSAIYVLGMALTYTIVGVLAGLTGTLLSSALQNPWVLSVFAAVFVMLALSMFGFYELQLPSALQSRLSEQAGGLRGGKGVGVFIMGAVSALIVGPCVAAPLAGALIYISQTGDAVLGGTVLFAMALGMGVPLLLVGLSAGTLLPRTGPWMEGIKRGFGVLLLFTAIWIVSPVLPELVSMLAYGFLLTITAIFLHALDPLPPRSSGWLKLWKGVGVILLLAGAAILLGALAGNRDPLQPLSGFRTAAAANELRPLPFERISSLEALEARLESSAQPVILDFYADWCVSCKEMERFTFSDPGIRAKMASFTLLQADVTANSPADKALLQRFKLFGPPGIIFFDRQGQELEGFRVVGFQDAEKFGTVLDQVSRQIQAPAP